MKAKSFFLITLVLVCSPFFAQKFSSHPISLIPEVEQHVYFNENEYKASLEQRYAGQFKLDIRLNDFVYQNLEEMGNYFRSDQLYLDMKAEQDYLMNLVKKVIPDGYSKNDIKIYLVRDPYFNASCAEDGSIFVNTGMLATLNSEAELAAILAHEYGHYYYKHQLKGFKKTRNAFLGTLLFGRLSYVKLYGDLRRMEKQSDLMAIKLFAKNGFTKKAIVFPFKEMQRINKVFKNRKDNNNTFSFYRTHPANRRRIKYLQTRIDETSNTNQSNFQVDSATFTKVKNKAIDECIYNYFENQNFLDCIELAYRMHLTNPDDEFYLYYIIESLRRRNELFPKQKNNNFITERYKFKNSQVNSTVSSAANNSIHYHLKNLYGLTDSVLNTLPNVALSKNNYIEFVTNLEAQAYFLNLAKGKFGDKYEKLFHLEAKNEIAIDSIGNADLAKYILDQINFKAEDSVLNRKTTPLFFNNFYASQAGRRKYRTQVVTKNSIETKEFKKFIFNRNENYLAELDTLFDHNPKLNYRETVNLNAMLNIVSDKIIYNHFELRTKVKKKFIYRKQKTALVTPLKVYDEIPELNLISLKYNYNKIFFVDFLETTPNQLLLNPNKFRNKLNILFYCIDLEKNVVYRFYKQFNYRYFNYAEYANFYPDLIEYIKEMKKKLEKS